MYDLILGFITSFALTYVAIPSIINLAHKKNLMDEPGDRRSHTVKTPSLGGIAIFAGMLFSIIMWTPFNYFGDLQYILCSFIIIFLIGVKDDLDPMSPTNKLIGEIFATVILIFKANIIITSLYGIFGIYELPYAVSVILTIFTIIVIINGFNLIDGINGLSGSISLLIALVLGTWFYKVNKVEIAMIAFALSGAIVAFLRYNITPAKIFMGDTGSLLLGLVCSILSILFIEEHKNLVDSPFKIQAAPSFAIATLILPLFDTLRVFVLRFLKGKGPFTPDRTHIHHLLIDYGYSHMQATSILLAVNVFFIIIAFKLQKIGNLNLLAIMLGLAILMSFSLHYLVEKKKLSNQSS